MNARRTIYGTKFYEQQMSGSYRSARIYADHLATFFPVATVVDVGCGRGTWLKAFMEVGATRLVGLDGSWNSQQNMVDDAILFRSCDLNEPIPKQDETRFDLAMSLEVAEHLQPSSASVFVKSLAGLADVILFSAAFTGQGGTNHLNERPHTYWAKEFGAIEYVPFDIFRPSFWGDERVEVWYRQNTFLYVRKDSHAYRAITSKNIAPLPSVAFMDCVHPAFYQGKLQQGVKQSLSMTIKACLLAIQRRLSPTKTGTFQG